MSFWRDNLIFSYWTNALSLHTIKSLQVEDINNNKGKWWYFCNAWSLCQIFKYRLQTDGYVYMVFMD
jgi:hypothetical protein